MIFQNISKLLNLENIKKNIRLAGLLEVIQNLSLRPLKRSFVLNSRPVTERKAVCSMQTPIKQFCSSLAYGRDYWIVKSEESCWTRRWYFFIPCCAFIFLPYKKFLTFLFAFTQSTLELIQDTVRWEACALRVFFLTNPNNRKWNGVRAFAVAKHNQNNLT